MKGQCPKCGRSLGFGEEAVGRRGRCYSCGQLLAILQRGRLYSLEETPTSMGFFKRKPAETDAPKLKMASSSPENVRDHPKWEPPWIGQFLIGGLIITLLSSIAMWGQ